MYIIAGKDRGKTGKVLRALPKEERVIVEGVNKLKKHQKARKSGQKGQVIEVIRSIHVSNVAIVDSQSNKPSRVGFKVSGDQKIRITKKSGATI